MTTCFQVEMQSLAKIKEELTSGQEKLHSAVVTLDRELSELQRVCSGLEEEQVKLQKTLQALEAAGEEVDPDEVTILTRFSHYQVKSVKKPFFEL